MKNRQKLEKKSKPYNMENQLLPVNHENLKRCFGCTPEVIKRLQNKQKILEGDTLLQDDFHPYFIELFSPDVSPDRTQKIITLFFGADPIHQLNHQEQQYFDVHFANIPTETLTSFFRLQPEFINKLSVQNILSLPVLLQKVLPVELLSYQLALEPSPLIHLFYPSIPSQFQSTYQKLVNQPLSDEGQSVFSNILLHKIGSGNTWYAKMDTFDKFERFMDKTLPLLVAREQFDKGCLDKSSLLGDFNSLDVIHHFFLHSIVVPEIEEHGYSSANIKPLLEYLFRISEPLKDKHGYSMNFQSLGMGNSIFNFSDHLLNDYLSKFKPIDIDFINLNKIRKDNFNLKVFDKTIDVLQSLNYDIQQKNLTQEKKDKLPNLFLYFIDLIESNLNSFDTTTEYNQKVITISQKILDMGVSINAAKNNRTVWDVCYGNETFELLYDTLKKHALKINEQPNSFMFMASLYQKHSQDALTFRSMNLEQWDNILAQDWNKLPNTVQQIIQKSHAEFDKKIIRNDLSVLPGLPRNKIL